MSLEIVLIILLTTIGVGVLSYILFKSVVRHIALEILSNLPDEQVRELGNPIRSAIIILILGSIGIHILVDELVYLFLR